VREGTLCSARTRGQPLRGKASGSSRGTCSAGADVVIIPLVYDNTYHLGGGGVGGRARCVSVVVLRKSGLNRETYMYSAAGLTVQGPLPWIVVSFSRSKQPNRRSILVATELAQCSSIR
jgi:hypothetical protein